MKAIFAALLLGLLTACATHTPMVHIEPIIEANKRTKVAIQKTVVHQKQLAESQVKVSGSLEKVMNDLNQLVISPLVQDAKNQLEIAKAEQKHSQDLALWATQSNEEAWAFATETGKAAEVAKGEAQQQANELAKMKPVYDAVTRWWDLGAFVWGVKQLLKHLLILAIVGAALGLVVWGLTLMFPILGVGLGIAKGVIMRILKFVAGIFRRK